MPMSTIFLIEVLFRMLLHVLYNLREYSKFAHWFIKKKKIIPKTATTRVKFFCFGKKKFTVLSLELSTNFFCFRVFR